jgi:hypothetical protein
MTAGIPLSQIVTITPGVVGAGGNALALNAIFIDNAANVPLSSLLTFYDADDVGTYFGTSSTEYAMAAVYFSGFTNGTTQPYQLYFAGYAAADRAAWLRGSSLAGTTLATIQALSGSLSVTVDGVVKSAASVNLSAATSFTNAAALLTTALALTGGAAVTWDATSSRFVITSGTTGATSTMTQATGTIAAGLGLSAGVLSQGAAADTPASAMARIKALATDWATFATTWKPTGSDMIAFATWVSAQSSRYLYVAADNDPGYATASNSAVFGTIVDVNNYDGVVVVYGTTNHAAFICAWAASINWSAREGRATLAFRTQSGLATTVSDLATANAVLSNNASYFGLYQSDSGDTYTQMYDGRMNGSDFKWADTYINQIRLNSELRRTIFEGLRAVNTSPYNSLGYSYIRAWAADPIADALNNGTIRTGVTLSAAQKAEINAAAGLDISSPLSNYGYYLLISDATAATRSARTSPPLTLWYMDGGSIQKIALASIAVL